MNQGGKASFLFPCSRLVMLSGQNLKGSRSIYSTMCSFPFSYLLRVCGTMERHMRPLLATDTQDPQYVIELRLRLRLRLRPRPDRCPPVDLSNAARLRRSRVPATWHVITLAAPALRFA